MADNSGVLDQHAPRIPDKKESDLTPGEEEKKLCRQVDAIFEKNAKYRKRYDGHWVDNYKMFRGMQWSQKRPSYKHREVINLIFQTIQSQVSVMMDVRPTIGFLPEEPSDVELSEILNKVFESDWERNNWSDELLAQAYDSHIYGLGYSKLCYDEDASSIAYSCEDPLDFYPSEDATNVNKKNRSFVVAKPEELDEVKNKYAGHKYVHLLKPDLEDMSYFKRNAETLHKRKTTDLDMAQTSERSFSSPEEEKGKCLVVTVYLKPNETEVVEKDDQDAMGEKIYITKLKYPRGRKIVKINDYIMEDEALEYDHLEFPYQRLVNYTLPREFFGISEVENTKGPQMIFNKLVNFSLDVLTLMGNPIWKVPVGANVNTRKLINQPGLIVEHADGFEPKREEGVQLQPYVFQLIDRMEKWFNDEAGTQDVTRGINPTGVTANAAIENLLEAAQKRIKQKMRNLDSCLKDVGKQWVSLCFQYYSAPRIYRITNKEGVNQYFKFHIEDRDAGTDSLGQPKTQKVAIVRNYSQNETGKYLPAEEQNEYEIKGKFDVRVNTISGLPFAKANDEQKVLNLFDRAIIDDEEVLNRLEYPNREAVLQRVRQRQAEQAQAAPPPKEG